MAESTVAMPETEQTQAVTQPETPAVEATRPREHYMTPPVDIYETPESLVVIADMPGIDPAHLDAGGPAHPDPARPDPGADAGRPALPRIHAGQLLPAV